MTITLTLHGAVQYPVELTAFPERGAELAAVFAEYWDAVARPAGGPTRWSTTVSNVADGAWGSDTGAAAGAGGVATVLGRTCSTCDGPLTLTSRSAFDQAQNDEPVRCRTCTSQFSDRVNRLLSPAAQQQRAARQKARVQAADARQEQEQLSADRVAAVRLRYGTPRGDNAPNPFSESILVRVATLAIARRHMIDGVSIELERDEQTFAPETLDGAFYDTVNKLLAIHPATPLSAFVWAADAGPAAAEFGGRLYPDRLRLYRDDGHPTGEATQSLVEELEAHLALDMLTEREQEDLLLLARDVIAGEGIRYLEHQLARYRLPAVGPQHRDRLSAVMRRAADRYPLDAIYCLAWGAASAATNLLESRRTTREKASTYALNRLEKRLAALAENPDAHVESYALLQDLPLTSLTETVFFDVLQRGIVGVSVSDLRAAMPTPFDVRRRSECLAELPDSAAAADARDVLIAALAAGDGSSFRDALASIADDPFPECSFRCSHAEANRLIRPIMRKWDALAGQIGAQQASVAVATTLPWLDYRGAERRELPSTVLTNRLAVMLVEGPREVVQPHA